MWLIFVILIFIGIHVFRKLFKIPKIGNLSLITGGVKVGKTTLSCYFALKTYKKAVFMWNVKRTLFGFIKRFKNAEKPLLYSNVPLACDYVPLTEDLVLRKKRFSYGSVIYIQEASLLADSMDYDDEETNEALKLFNKLIGHETKGGYIIYDTQSVRDCHFATKRSLQTYFFIHHSVKVPFFVIMYVRELLYSEDDPSINNVIADDVEESGLRRVIVPKSIWRKFDCFTYSALTDDLPVEKSIVKGRKLKSLKTKSYLSIKKLIRLKVDQKKQLEKQKKLEKQGFKKIS